MIIWTRWGFLSFLGVGLGALLGFGFSTLLSLPDSGPIVGVIILAFGALVNLGLALWVYPYLDRPRPATATRPLAVPLTDENGRVVQTHEVVPLLDPEGNQAMIRPRSTIFFIPVKYVWIVLAAGAVALGVFALAGG